MENRNDILTMLKEILVNEFEIEETKITTDAHLYEDLELDSIDAIDLVVRLREITDKKIDPEAFKAVRTVDDIINEVHHLVAT